jgi:hypothetical protein
MICGNPNVVELLEAYLETARKAPFGHIAIAMVGHPNVGACDFAGDVNLELSSLEALGMLANKLKSSIDDWSLPPRDEGLDASYVCYNLRSAPLGFDFLVWLVDAEMTRVRENAPPPLKVAFWSGKSGNVVPEAATWQTNVFRQLIPLIGAVETQAAVRGHSSDVYVPRNIVRAAKFGEAVPRFRSSGSQVLPFAHGYVTITLREASHDPARNSRVDQWLMFARVLRDRGERVVFIRDTENAFYPLEDFQTCPAASIVIDARLAVYESAKANFFVSNGVAALAHFSNSPCIQFTEVRDDDPLNTERFWVDNMGIAPGTQYPWSRPNQRMFWAPDTFENMMRAWKEWQYAI